MAPVLSCPACGENIAAAHSSGRCPGCGNLVSPAGVATAAGVPAASSSAARLPEWKRKALMAGLIAGPPAVIVLVAILTAHVKARHPKPLPASAMLGETEEETAPAGEQVDPQPTRVRYLSLLWKQYGDDPAGADALYRGKRVEFRIKGRLQQDADGGWVLGAPMYEPTALTAEQYAQQTEKEQRWFRDGYPPNVLCRVALEQVQAFRALPADREVTVRGWCVGKKLDSDVGGGYVVLFNDCALVK